MRLHLYFQICLVALRPFLQIKKYQVGFCFQLLSIASKQKPIDRIRAIILIRRLITDTQTNTPDW